MGGGGWFSDNLESGSYTDIKNFKTKIFLYNNTMFFLVSSIEVRFYYFVPK